MVFDGKGFESRVSCEGEEEKEGNSLGEKRGGLKYSVWRMRRAA